MENNNEKQWREDFKTYLERRYRTSFPFSEIDSKWITELSYYMEARRKAHSQNEVAFKAFTLDLVERYEQELSKYKQAFEVLKEANDDIEKGMIIGWSECQERAREAAKKVEEILK